jgi:hypothetical protein
MGHTGFWSVLMPIYQATDINTIIGNTQALSDPSAEIGLNMNTEETNKMYMFHHQNEGQNHNIKTTNISLKNGAESKYLGVMFVMCLAGLGGQYV